MSNNISKRILVAPLDWGLGHTTRCIPIINHLKALGHSVIVACNDWQKSFIENIYTDIETVHLDGYNVTYSAHDKLGKISLLGSVPSICAAIKREEQWLQRHIKQLNIDGIISDNRYGLHHQSVPSVIITHQLEVQTGMGKGSNRLIQKLHYKFLAQFDGVWVPDVKGDINLGGQLSHPKHLPLNAQYIGLLSQFQDVGPKRNWDGYLLILLSGPEPQRSILEKILWQQAMAFAGKVVFVAGKEQKAPADIPGHITYHARLGGAELAHVIQGAALVVCRSGYSTIMDLMLLGKSGILIPTPGQTEQEYLATSLSESRFFMAATQKNIDLAKMVPAFAHLNRHSALFSDKYQLYKPVLEEWLNGI